MSRPSILIIRPVISSRGFCAGTYLKGSIPAAASSSSPRRPLRQSNSTVEAFPREETGGFPKPLSLREFGIYKTLSAAFFSAAALRRSFSSFSARSRRRSASIMLRFCCCSYCFCCCDFSSSRSNSRSRSRSCCKSPEIRFVFALPSTAGPTSFLIKESKDLI